MTTGTLQAEQRAGLTQQRRYKVIDTGPGFTWQREYLSRAGTRPAAEQEYRAACAAAGIAPGLLIVARVRDLAVAA